MIDILDLAYAQYKSLHKRKQTDRENKQREALRDEIFKITSDQDLDVYQRG